jgi:hypothetical protein
MARKKQSGMENQEISTVDSAAYGNRNLKKPPRKNKPRTLAASNSSVQDLMSRNASTDISMSASTSFFSPILSTDFLQLPQTAQEKRFIIRHFYATDPIVGQSIDLHSELPLSKVRFAKPKVCNNAESQALGFENSNDRAEYILDFYTEMSKRIKLFYRLLEIAHEWYLLGEVFIWAEDSEEVEIPEGYGVERVLKEDGQYHNVLDEKKIETYRRKMYQGWGRVTVLPPDLVNAEHIQFADIEKIELTADSKTKELIKNAAAGDEEAAEQVEHIPADIREYIAQDENIPLGTDPYEGSFVHHLSWRKSAYDPNGISLVERCLRYLMYREKLRQTQTQIADRAMTPKRLIWAEDLSEEDLEDLRTQVDSAMVDPDFSIITNYEVHWTDIGAKERLLDINTEFEMTNKLLYIGLGVTESLLVGENSYGGDRLRIEVINTRYLLFREIMQSFVEEQIFEPVARKKGFYEHDKWGNIKYLYPKLQFTRLALRDTQDTFDQLFNLYQKGSVPVGVILDLLNLDPEDTKLQLEKDLLTVNDAVFNELLRNVYSSVSGDIVSKSDLAAHLIKYLKLKNTEEPEEGDDDSGGGGDMGGFGDFDLTSEGEGGEGSESGESGEEGDGEESTEPAEE